MANSDQIIANRLNFPAYFYVLTLNLNQKHPVLIHLQDLVTPSHLRQTVRQNLLPHYLSAFIIAATMLTTTAITIMIMITTASITKAMLTSIHWSFPNWYLLELYLLQVTRWRLMHSYWLMLMIQLIIQIILLMIFLLIYIL